MLVLGLESSCDETGAAVVEDGVRILSNVVASQHDLHGPFGGVVPEVAARAHAEKITAIIEQALTSANVSKKDLDGIAVVNRPGLVGALLVGISAAKGLALSLEIPIVFVDHIEAHVYASHLAGFQVYPHVSLIVSGGHTCLYLVEGPGKMETLGQTKDDAAGEAFDKVAKMLGLGFPGGPALSKSALNGDPTAVAFSRCGPNEKIGDSLTFSYSGLKTAVLYEIRRRGFTHKFDKTKEGGNQIAHCDPQQCADIAASFQEAACEIMVEKALAACKKTGIQGIAVGGGVACNKRLRDMFAERAALESPAIEVFFPPIPLCADNAAMTAGLGYFPLSAGETHALDQEADPTPKRAPYRETA